MTTSITEYSATDAALADLRTRFEAVVFDVSTTKGMDQAKKARAELRDYRVKLEKTRVDIKAPALERCRQIDSEAKRITAELEALEEPIDQQIKKEEDRKAAEKAERERIERERIEAINARFNEIKALPLAAVNATADEIREQLAEADLIDPETFPEDLRAAAQYEKRLAITALFAALDRRLMADEEAARIKAEREELERLRAEAAAVQAEKDRLAEEERQRVLAEERRQEEQARTEREAAERAAREAREEEQRRREDAERAEAQRKLREEQAAAAAERQRLEAEKKAAAKLAREQAIATATLISAATGALELLKAEGFGEHVITQTLEAAIGREQPQKKVA